MPGKPGSTSQPTSAPTRRTAAQGGSGGGSGRGGSGGGSGSGGSGGGSRRSSGRGAARPGKRRLIDYPRAGKHGVRRWLPSWRLVLGTFLALGALGVGAFVALYMTVKIPKPGDFAEAQTTTVYYADGTTKMGTYGVQNRVIVPSDQISEEMKQAAVAGEDRTFYKNPGIDPVGMLRALYTDLRYGTRQGGSSITQQYAERYYFDQTVSSYSGKLKEAMLAVKLDRAQDKDEILSNYLNTIYFGRDSYGVQTAAQSYFGVDAKDLDTSQAALLAAVIPSPNNFDPRVSMTQAERRWNYVLDGMVVTGHLTQAERDAQQFPETIEYAKSDKLKGPQGYLLTMVQKELETEAGISEDQLNTVGYKVVTTIDPTLQNELVDTMSAMPEGADPNLHAGAVTLDPTDDAIVALYGGPDYLVRQRNAVTQDEAVAGSTFKPFTLAAYLENGGSLKSKYSGKNKFVVGDFTNGVTNFRGESLGQITVLQATADSVNVVYAQMNDEIGPDKTREAAIAAGLPESTRGLDSVSTSNVLGTASPHPIDMARAYATFATGGLRADPFIVRTATRLDGSPVYSGGVTPERAFPEDVMADVTYAMQQVTKKGGTAPQAGTIGYPVAGKTGTSSDNLSAWFVGFTPQLVTAVALYQLDDAGNPASITPFGGYREVTGGSVPADLWTTFMKQAMAGRDKVDFPPPAYVGTPNVPPTVQVPDVTGMTEADARTALGTVGLTSTVAQANDPTVPQGQVISSDPAPGTEVDQGSAVTITVSLGPGTVGVPDVVGLAESDATALLTSLGLSPSSVTEPSDTVPAGSVISVDPGVGTQVAPGDAVQLTVSSGPAAPTESPSPSPSPSSTPSPSATAGGGNNKGGGGG
jgi:membrane peptidoglycan carboxypeptidase